MENDNHEFIDIEAAQRERREKRAQALKSRRRKVEVAKAEAEKARRGFITGRRLILICVSVSVVFFVVSSAFRIVDLKGREERATFDLKVKAEQKERLENKLSRLGDKEYIEDQARERLGMVKKGETLYIFDDPSGAEDDGEGSGSDNGSGSGGETDSGDDSGGGADA